MKKYFLFLNLVCVIATYGQTPIPNGGFENWNSTNYEYPQYYQYTSNPNAFASGLPFNVVKTADKQNGDSAIMITSYGNDNGMGYFANIDPQNSGDDPNNWHGGMVITETPTGIQGYYKYNIESPDSAVIILVFTHAGANCGTYFFKIGGNKTDYTYFNFPFPGFTETPDSVVFAVVSSDISNEDLEIVSGTTLILDNVSFTGMTTQPEKLNGDFESWETGQTPYFLASWNTDNNSDGVNRSTDKHDGNYALELTTTSGNGGTEARQAEATNGYWSDACNCQMGGIPFSNQIDTLAFWYKYVPSGSDSAEINLSFKKNCSDMGGRSKILNSSVDYQYIEFPFDISGAQTPDSVVIRIISSSPGNGTGRGGGSSISLSCIGSELTIDSLRFKSTTPPPTSVTSSAVDQTSATISWTAPSPAPSNGYQYEIRISGGAGSGASGLTTSGSTAAGDVNADVSGLTKATTYSVYVRANFGGAGFSSWSNVYNFSTACDAISSFPWIENINTASPPSIPVCWSQNNTNSDGCQWQTWNNGGNVMFNIQTGGTNGNNNDYLILPQMSLTGNKQLYFKVASADPGNPNSFRVVLSEGGNAPSDFTNEIMSQTVASSNTLTEITPINLSSYSGHDVWIAIHIPNTGSNCQGLFVDDFTIADIPACSKPTAVTSSSVAKYSATISWTASVSTPANGYQYEIRTSGDAGSGATGLTTSGNTAAGVISKDIAGLTASTNYYVYVRSDCGGDGYSEWTSAYNFATLCDPISSFPFTENLDGVSQPSLPLCWSQNNANSDGCQWKTSGNWNNGGNAALYINTSSSGGNNNDFLILPQISLTGNKQLYFKVASDNTGNPNSFRVVLSEGGNAPADFDHEIMSQTVASSNTLTEITPINLSTFSGDVWIAIHIPNTGSYCQGLFVDDIVLEDIPACSKPTAVTSSGVTTNFATISWTASISNPTNGYQYEVRTSGNAGSGLTGLAKSGNTAAGVVSKDISGLTASTNYYVYVRAICDAPDTSEWTNAYNFTTVCDIVSSFPWTENLNTVSPPSFPVCWSQNNANSDGRQWQTWNNGGNTSFNIQTGGSGGNNNDYLILPQISLTGGNKQLSFKVASANPGSPNSFRVVLSEGGNAPSDFTYEIMPTTVASNNSLTEITPINLSDHSGHDVWIAIHVPNTGTECQGLFADDFIIEDIPSCSKPTALTISAVSQTSATISWTAPTPAPANGYQYEIRAFGDAGSGSNGLTVLGTTAAGDVDDNIIGLTASTNYNAYVRAICGSEDTSAWTSANNFSTPCDITTAPFTESFESGNVPPSCWSATYPGVFWSNTGYSSYGSGNVSALARFYTFSNTNPFDLISNTFDISGMSTPTLTFDYAYATRSGQTDQLDVYYSTNGGVNFIPLLNMPGGTAGILNTAGTIVSEFFPSSSQWKTQVISLPAGTNKLKFTATSANGNNLFIDNIKVSDLIIWTGETSTAWSNINNWNPKAIPTSTNDVIIPSGTANEPYVDISTPAACKNLTINPGSTLTIDAGKYLTASGTTTNNGTFTIKSTSLASTGSFIDNGIAGIGNYNVEKYLEGTNYYYVGIPISGIRSTVFDILGGNKLWSHSETTGLYSSVLDNVTLNVKQGYVTKLLIPKTVSFSGTSINTGTQTNNLTLTSPASAFEGYNLICNPYPSAVDIESATTDASNLETTIWYRSGGNFYTYNWTGHSGTGSRYVPAMQAFWTKVAAGNSNGTLIFENADRLHNSQAFYKATSQPNVLRMQVSNGTLNDEVLLGFYQNASDNFENYDSRKMFGDDEYPQLYSLTSDNIKVAINGYPELSANNEKVVPLGFKTSTSGSFTINAINLGEFDVSIPVYLEDAQQSIIQDLRQTNTYAFTSPVIDDANRFKLHFGNTITSVPANSESAISVYATNKTIYINTPKNANVKVYDVLGNLILNQQAVQGLNKFQLNVETGIYITKVQTEGQIITQKVMLNK